jgi:galactonate dehydratase
VPPSWVWLRIHTDEGLRGLSEPYLENHPERVIAEVRRLEPVSLGQDPTQKEGTCQKRVKLLAGLSVMSW